MSRVSNPNDVPKSEDDDNKAPANGKTILIAEDDPFISRMYQTKLTSAGYSVVLKNNGRDAYETAKAGHIDLIMLDINMPELSGLEVLQALKNDGFNFNSCPVMILTNSSNSEHRALADGYGADYMIKAELTPREVLEHINTRLGLAQGG